MALHVMGEDIRYVPVPDRHPGADPSTQGADCRASGWTHVGHTRGFERHLHHKPKQLHNKGTHIGYSRVPDSINMRISDGSDLSV